jgi:hypothetical protein
MAIEWAVENVRLSLFSKAAVLVSDTDWKALTGQQEADTRQNVPGGRILAGPYDGGQLNLAGTANRADIIQTSVPGDASSPAPRLPTFGAWDEVRDKFVKFTAAWLKNIEFPIVRIAFGAVLLAPVKDRKVAYEGLDDLLSSVTIKPEMKELLFRVNYPTTSKAVASVTLNRITNWSAIQFLARTIQLGNLEVNPLLGEAHAIRLELDHSTDAARMEPFTTQQAIDLYAELVKHASENATKGEIA